tara:strand:+ start:2451 stop:3236 length:786 start_codon:yes stop_codon:yes gene_type:complete
MIKFFRHIRKTYLMENKTGKYFKYAIGEILLVMIGILLALAVNNWNNQRSNRQLEVKYLLGLKADLQYNLINLEEFMDERKVKIISAMRVLEMSIPKGAKELNTMDSIIWQVFRWKKFVPRSNTMNELLGSGNLSLIQNDSIKALMQNIEQSYEILDVSTEHMRREFDHYLYDRSAKLRELSPFIDVKKSIEKNERVNNLVKSISELRELEAQAKALLNDLTFRTGLKLAVGNNNDLHVKSAELKNAINDLILKLDNEIKK